jgi:hypothetical protein
MLTELYPPEPCGYCFWCHAPLYLIKAEIYRTCSCMGDFAGCLSIISAAPPEIQFLSTPPASPRPESMPYASFEIPDPDSITVEQARARYNSICQDIRAHQARCKVCDALQRSCTTQELLSRLDVMCQEQRMMWQSRLWWSKKMPPEEVCYA